MGRKPNLLFLFTDQQRYDTLACYGNHVVQTPNLNRLADESFVFDKAYVTQPLCTPSRSSIMTGLYPHATGCIRNNIPLRPETPTIAEMVTDDYVRAYVGKWHLGDEVIAQHGFETWISIMDRYRQYYTRPEFGATMSDYHHYLVAKGYEPDSDHHGARIFGRQITARMPEHHTKARFVGREAARFIREVGDEPFMLYVNFFEPHPPITGPLDDLHDPDAVVVGPCFREPPPENAALANRVLAEFWVRSKQVYGVNIETEAGWRRIWAHYLGLVALIDRAVGDILGALEERGLDDNTIVVFTSDHGEMMGDHAMFQKGVNYEESIRVPLLMRVPWLGREQRRMAAPISQVDLVPTLLDLLDEPIPHSLHGQSRAPALEGHGELADGVVVEWHAGKGGGPSSWASYEGPPPDLPWQHVSSSWRTLVSADGWKLCLRPTDRSELYHLAEDPYERVNLFEKPEHRTRVQDMTTRLRVWQARTGDTASPEGARPSSMMVYSA